MLVELKLRNFAIIDDISINFGRHLNVITGETGTGKSLIVEAITVILGGKFSRDQLKSQKIEASVEALFEFPADSVIWKKLEDCGVEDRDGELVIKRTLPTNGKTRVYVNGSIASLALLSRLTEGFINIFSQHEHQVLLKKSSYLAYLDAFSQLEHDLSEYRDTYAELARVQSELDAFEKKEREGAQREDFLRFSVDEITRVSPQPGEDATLDAERVMLENSEKFSCSLTNAMDVIYEGENSAAGFLKRAASHLGRVSDLDSSLEDLHKRVSDVLIETEDVFYGLSEFAGRLEHNPERLNEVVSRLEEIKKLKRKYGDSIEDMLKKCGLMGRELEDLKNHTSVLEEKKRKRDSLLEKVLGLAKMLSVKRKEVARKIEQLFAEKCDSVGIGNAKFSVEFKEKELSSDGADNVMFLFSANPGQKPRPVNKVASGGELSRIMLLLRSFVAPSDSGAVLVFDEVDAGIGGSVAETIGKKIKNLSDKNQVICITHLPQIAKFADTHLLVSKKFSHDETDVSVDILTEEQRVVEISRMLAGQSVSEKTLEAARELINGTERNSGAFV